MLRYFRDKNLKLLVRMFLVLILAMSFAGPAFAQGSGGGGSGGGSGSSSSGSGGSGSGGGGGGGGNNGTLSEPVANDGLQTGAFDVREDYRRANKLSIPFGPPTTRNPDGLDEVVKRESVGPATVDHGSPVYAWPVVIPAATSAVPTKRDVGITKHRLKTFGLPVSDTQYQIIHRMNQQIMLEEMFDPERIMWLGACIGTSQVQDSSNSFANIIRQQSASAIDYVSCTIVNFTTEKGNKWNKIRDQLFMPMAILLLLPGAMLAQVKVIVASGMPIGGADSSPFEGIVRSIVAIFLIPATYLVVNYSVDLNNSLTVTISDNYTRIFGSNMYKDALCMVIKAFPLRQSHENRNGIYKEVVPWEDGSGEGGTPAAGLEQRSLKVKLEDPCSGEFKTDPDRADEQAPFISVGQRFFTNMSNAVLAMTWNVLCAFQVVFLMYLWLVGPVIAALWVYPHDTLRGAFPGWVEGVVTLAFWGLFWNTTVLLMACFKGCDSTGSIICSALLFLSIQSVKSAFDFAGLVKEAGAQVAGAMNHAAEQMNNKSKAGIAGGGGGPKTGGHGGGPKGGGGSSSTSSHRGSGTVGGSMHAASGHAAGAHPAGLAGHGTSMDVKAPHSNMSVFGTVSTVSGHQLGSAGGSLAGTHGKADGLSSSGADGYVTGRITDSSGSGSGGLGVGGGFGAEGSSGAQGLAGQSGSGTDVTINAPTSSSGAVNPPSMSFSSDTSVSNSSSSSFSTFNANSLTGTVEGAQGRYTAGEAAGLIGRENLANFPREGQVMSKEQALANYNAAAAYVAERNAGGFGGQGAAEQRNDLMDKWKSELLDAGQHTSADGKLIGVPDSLPGTASGGNWNLPPEAASGAGALPQGFGPVFDNVNGALQNAGAALMMPGSAEGQGLPLNPQAVQGLTSLSREMTEVGPQLANMTPQAQGATIEAWQQRAEVLSQQMYSGGGAPNAEAYARMSNDIAQAQNNMQQFQQSYPAASGADSSTTYNSATYSQGGDTSYQQGGSNYYSGAADASQQQSGYQQSGGGYYQQAAAPQQDPGAASGPAYYAGSQQGGDAGYAQQQGPQQGSQQFDQSSQSQNYYQQGSPQIDQSQQSQQYYQQGGGSAGDASSYYNQGSPQQQYDQSSQQNYYSQQTGDASNYTQPLQQQLDQSGGYYASQQSTQQIDQSYSSQAQQQTDQNMYYQQQQQAQADQQAYNQQQQSYQQQVEQNYQQQQAYQQQADQSYQQQQGYQQADQGYQQQQNYQQPSSGSENYYQGSYGGSYAQSVDPQQHGGGGYAQPSDPGSAGHSASGPAPAAGEQHERAHTPESQQQQYSSGSGAAGGSGYQAPAPQSHPSYSAPIPSQSMQRPADKAPAPPRDKPQDKPPEPKPAAPPSKDAPKHAVDPMKFNPLKQKAPPKKKPEDGPTPPPPQQ